MYWSVEVSSFVKSWWSKNLCNQIDMWKKYFDRKTKELLETDAILRDEIPVIRRFTGGGTVIVDQGTIFVTFICNKDAISGLQSYPRPIMSWSSLIYKNMFQGIGEFSLRENGMYIVYCLYLIIVPVVLYN